MATNTILSGYELSSWLTTQLDFFYNNQEGLEKEILISTLKNRLTQTECHPDDSQSLFDYHRLWIAVGDTSRALHTLEQFESSISDTLEGMNQQYFSVLVSYWKTNLYAGHDKDKFIAEGDSLIQKLQAYPNRDHVLYIWDKLIDGCAFLALWDRYRQLYRLKIAYQPQFSEDSVHFIEGQLAILSEDCRSYSTEGNKAEAIASAQKLINRLKEGQSQGKVTQKIWIDNANAIVYQVPEIIDEMINHIKNYAENDWHIAKKRDLDISIKQIEARSKYAQSKLDEAINIGLSANYELMYDTNYFFTMELIDWLIEANQIDKAGEIALDTVLLDLPNVSTHAYKIASRLQNTHPSIYWHLILCWDYCRQLTGFYHDKNPNLAPISDEQKIIIQNAFNETFAAAKQIDSNHVGLEVLEFYYFRQRKNEFNAVDYHKQIVQQCELYFSNANNYRSMGRICAYYRSKAYLEGIESVINAELITASEATENLYISVDLFLSDEEWEQYVDYRKDITTLKIKYQEIAKKQFEHFFETGGNGHFRDGNIHNYSMLLRNISSELCESYNKSPEELIVSSKTAIELSTLAISISPFAEHYYGLFTAYANLKDENAMIESAESLWQFSVRYGFSRFMPQKIVTKFARSLHNQGRHAEIQTWIERLEQWFAWLPREQQEEQNESYFFSRIFLLSHIVTLNPETSALRLEKELTSNPAYWDKDETIALNIACIYRDLEQLDKAVEFYQLALGLAQKYEYQPVIEVAERNLKTIKDRLNTNTNSNQKPWWKFW
ncbi:hypothetical protein [Thorsellia anophelis]|uniref:Tetratricopeptide repeat-containing protein n=1 Tax=Thorsellia anophelis DSM 18579 TaxID=1123402 RepID=A0A1I0G3E2_9GAMM|nr:hypothetical protein [Thorsellia anophelis]SET64394.1 hypothetical protein SAMN02583745_02956 [Thorsellia anophelis DSM 18579]